MDIQQIEASFEKAGRFSGTIDEFEVLQDIVTAVTLQALIGGAAPSDLALFRKWYLEQLVRLHAQLVAITNRGGPAYHLGASFGVHQARLRMEAILDLYPEQVIAPPASS